MKCRPLSLAEIHQLERQGCTSAEWTEVFVAQSADSSTLPWYNVHFEGRVEVGQSVIRNSAIAHSTVGNECLIENARDIKRTVVGDGCRIVGTDRVHDVTLTTSDGYPPSTIGAGCIVEDSTVSYGSVVENRSIVRGCTVSECSTITDGFTAIDSRITVNSHLACGEAVESECGPFCVSHHKSTLLIAGHYEFFNAGSGTNFSNHAYKMGPFHHGEMLRGCKTASNAHLIWPAKIGCFTMCMGKIATHPDSRSLPFSYLMGSNDGTVRCIPGRSVASCGLFRDVRKWEKRDQRPADNCPTTVDYNWLNADILPYIESGLSLLETWKDDTCYNGMTILGRDIEPGKAYYKLLLRLAAKHTAPDDYLKAARAWADMLSEDAAREYNLGDIEQEVYHSFISEVSRWLTHEEESLRA